jgi:hypothetical protein
VDLVLRLQRGNDDDTGEAEERESGMQKATNIVRAVGPVAFDSMRDIAGMCAAERDARAK